MIKNILIGTVLVLASVEMPTGASDGTVTILRPATSIPGEFTDQLLSVMLDEKYQK